MLNLADSSTSVGGRGRGVGKKRGPVHCSAAPGPGPQRAAARGAGHTHRPQSRAPPCTSQRRPWCLRSCCTGSVGELHRPGQGLSECCRPAGWLAAPRPPTDSRPPILLLTGRGSQRSAGAWMDGGRKVGEAARVDSARRRLPARRLPSSTGAHRTSGGRCAICDGSVTGLGMAVGAAGTWETPASAVCSVGGAQVERRWRCQRQPCCSLGRGFASAAWLLEAW